MNSFNWLIFNTTHDIIYFLLGFFIAILICLIVNRPKKDALVSEEEQ